MNIYLISIDSVNEFIEANSLNKFPISTIEFAEGMSEELCMELCTKSKDALSGHYTPYLFEATFNNDINGRINSDKYFIRMF